MVQLVVALGVLVLRLQEHPSYGHGETVLRAEEGEQPGAAVADPLQIDRRIRIVLRLLRARERQVFAAPHVQHHAVDGEAADPSLNTKPSAGHNSAQKRRNVCPLHSKTRTCQYWKWNSVFCARMTI